MMSSTCRLDKIKSMIHYTTVSGISRNLPQERTSIGYIVTYTRIISKDHGNTKKTAAKGVVVTLPNLHFKKLPQNKRIEHKHEFHTYCYNEMRGPYE